MNAGLALSRDILAYHTDLRTPPPSVATPPPTWDVMWHQTIWPRSSGGGWSSHTQEHLSVSIDSSVTVLRSNQTVGLPRFGLVFTFVNMCARTWYHHHFHHPSSASSSSKNFTNSLTPEWKNVVLLFAMVSSSFAGFCNGSALDFPFYVFVSILQWESLFKNPYGSAV